MQEANHNYGVVLIVWDWLFGTRLLPSDRMPPEDVGIGTMRDFPAGYWAQLASPFVWPKLEAKSLEAKSLAARSLTGPR
jgi:sterol desaturase/sphingolipid hydroxylase (fatty acid hydroxylase superfamily)